MDQVILFDKSLQQRLEEYKEVLSGYEVLPVSNIKKEWSFYMELTLDPSGWQAIWKIPRRTCEVLKISFPTVVLVYVLRVEFDELTALIRVLAVQDEIHLVDKHHVPLVQLWPTKHQDQSVGLNLENTANVLDMLRFFYTNLLMPWDYEDDESSDWKKKHLESRLRLYYDVKNGVIPLLACEHLHSLLTEARHLQVKREVLESELDSDDEDNVGSANVKSLMQIHVRLMEIKNEIDILEHPLLRSVIIEKINAAALSQEEAQQSVWLVTPEATADDYVNFLEKVKASFPEETLKISHRLSLALESGNCNDIYVLNESSHRIKATGSLEGGGVLKGLVSREKTVLTSTNEAVMFDLKGDRVLLENLTIDATSVQLAIIVRRGHVVLNKCTIFGDGKSSTQQGIIVLAGGFLEMVECDVSNFSKAIIGNSNANISITSSNIHDVDFGVKIYDNCGLKAAKTVFRNCKEYGVCVETENSSDNKPGVGTFETLNIIPQVVMESIKGENNEKGDAIINKKAELKPLEDLFGDPNHDVTVCEDSDDDMDNQMNVTVIENGDYGTD